ncbi:MAG TPA: hypothetical protein VLL25_12110 [Acidimicrobiales bacterium]|nr:hypothetical protein [Acidimicrobiales bacterium]
MRELSCENPETGARHAGNAKAGRAEPDTGDDIAHAQPATDNDSARAERATGDHNAGSCNGCIPTQDDRSSPRHDHAEAGHHAPAHRQGCGQRWGRKRRRRRQVPALSPASPRYTRRIADVATLGGAALATCSAAIHLHLWLQGYRHIPDIGRLFLAQGVLGVGIAAGAVATRRGLTALAGAVYLAATSVGLLLSATIGVFNFHDGLDAPYAGLALTIQLVGLMLFGLAAVEFRRGAGGNRAGSLRRADEACGDLFP